MDWRNCETDPPENGIVVDTISPQGRQQPLKRKDRLWFIPDGSMYVYYTPQWWKPITQK